MTDAAGGERAADAEGRPVAASLGEAVTRSVTVVRGERVAPADAARFDALVALQDSAAAGRRLDEFAKWIFGGTTVVGALLIGLTSTGAAPTRGAGQVAHALALASLGLSLALAASSLAPKWVGFNPHSLEQRERAVAAGLAARRAPLTWAARAFALSLVAAGATPLAGSCAARRAARPRVGIGYTVADSGLMTATLTAAGLLPGSVVDLAMALPRRAPVVDAGTPAGAVAPTGRDTVTGAPLRIRALPRARAVVGADGAANVSLSLRDAAAIASDRVLLVGNVIGNTGPRADTVAVPFARLAPVTGNGSTPGTRPRRGAGNAGGR